MGGERVFIAVDKKIITAFASVWEAENFLHHLYVSPQFQSKGIGSVLLEKCIGELGLPMSLKCLESNFDARRFYEKRGWQAAESGPSPEGRYMLYVREK